MNTARPFVDLARYPQVSVQADAAWSAPLLGGVGCNVFLGRRASYPAWSDQAAWSAIFAHLRDLRVGMLRVGFLPHGAGDIAGDAESFSPWDDARQCYDPQHDFFAILQALDTLAQELGAPIMLDPWWVPRSLQVPGPPDQPGWRGAPADAQAYATRFIVPLVRHVQDVLHCRAITCLGLLNEPIWNAQDRNPANFGVPAGTDQLRALCAMYATVRAALDQQGYTALALVGPSALCAYQFPMADFLASDANPLPSLGVLDHHYYMYHNDHFAPPNEEFFSTHETINGNVQRWCDFARRVNKPFIISEMGSFAYGRLFWGERDLEGPASHTAAISDAQFIVRGLAHGVQAFLRWALRVRRQHDGRWSIIDWHAGQIAPTPNTYPMYRELMRAVRPGCQVQRVACGHSAGRPCAVHAIATRCGTDLHLLIVNDEPGKNHDIILGPGPWSGLRLRRIVVDETRKGVEGEPITCPADPATGVEFVLSPYSLTHLTTCAD